MNVIMDDRVQIAHNTSQIAATRGKKRHMDILQ